MRKLAGPLAFDLFPFSPALTCNLSGNSSSPSDIRVIYLLRLMFKFKNYLFLLSFLTNPNK